MSVAAGEEVKECRESEKVGQGAVECLGRISLAGTTAVMSRWS